MAETQSWPGLERAMGFEPTTLGLASRCSTAGLLERLTAVHTQGHPLTPSGQHRFHTSHPKRSGLTPNHGSMVHRAQTAKHHINDRTLVRDLDGWVDDQRQPGEFLSFLFFDELVVQRFPRTEREALCLPRWKD